LGASTERPVAADADQAIDVELAQPVGHPGDGLDVVGVDIVARRAQDRPAAGRVELGDRVEQRVEVDVGDLGIEQAAESLDDAEQLDAGLVGPVGGPDDGGVQRRRVAARGQDADPLHKLSSSLAAETRRDGGAGNDQIKGWETNCRESIPDQ
jgi:hypothetical protein